MRDARIRLKESWGDMTLDELIQMFVQKNDDNFVEWRTEAGPDFWSSKVNEEAGEIAGVINKNLRFKRGYMGKMITDTNFKPMMETEIGDVLICLVFLAESCGIDIKEALKDCLVKNFERFGWIALESNI